MVELILFCLGTASLTLFLEMTFYKGMIFRKYYNWITYWLGLPKKNVRYRYFNSDGAEVTNLTGLDALRQAIKGDYLEVKECKYVPNSFIWLWKILGGCSYCFGTWIYLILYMATIGEIAGSIVLGIGFNYVFIKALEKL